MMRGHNLCADNLSTTNDPSWHNRWCECEQIFQLWFADASDDKTSMSDRSYGCRLSGMQLRTANEGGLAN